MADAKVAAQGAAGNDVTQERLKELLHYDQETGIFRWAKKLGSRAKPGQVAGCLDHHGHRVIRLDKRLYRASRLAWLYVYGEFPTEADHINRNRNDDRIVNLRNVNRVQNCQNTGKHRDNTSGHRGVYWIKRENRWLVQICAKRKVHYVGHFDNKDDAISAAKQAYERLHGEFACTS